MPVAAAGAFAGLALALAPFFFLRALAARVELPETKKTLKVVGIMDLVLFPIVGWFIAPLIVGD